MLKELFLPVSIMAVLASIIVPLPTAVMDFLLVGNLILALILLISTLYIHDSLKLSTLPTILLLATLFRLALNISTTRLILSEGDAGEAVQAFGTLVIQGNLIVGVVIFLVITLVQFIVIAKGSERVAEVSARFTLDAMPGKQMSIDADVRAGLIDFDMARKKRQELQTESRFYGALDGAMKFVKGDAIAGIVITMINLLGGFAIGVLVEGLDIPQSVAKYSVLTVGDGLLSQVPALLNSLAAGLVVTRVAGDKQISLASEVLGQFTQFRKVKLQAAYLCLLLAMIPGIPKFAFISVASMLFISAYLQKSSETNQETQSSGAAVIFNPKVPPILQIAITQKMAAVLSKFADLNDRIDFIRQNIFNEYGLMVMRPDLSLFDLSLSADNTERTFQFNVRGTKVKRITIAEDKDERFAVDTFIAETEKVFKGRIIDFVDDIQSRRLLDFFDKEAPELVSSVVPAVVSVTQLTYIIKSLINENIPVRNFDIILQAIAESVTKVSGERAILEEVRVSLKNVISDKFADDGVLSVVTIDAAIDLCFVQAEKGKDVIDNDYLEYLISEVTELKSEHSFVLLCSKGARNLLRECLALRQVKIPVIAHEEISADCTLKLVSRIKLDKIYTEDQILERIAA